MTYPSRHLLLAVALELHLLPLLTAATVPFGTDLPTDLTDLRDLADLPLPCLLLLLPMLLFRVPAPPPVVVVRVGAFITSLLGARSIQCP